MAASAIACWIQINSYTNQHLGFVKNSKSLCYKYMLFVALHFLPSLRLDLRETRYFFPLFVLCSFKTRKTWPHVFHRIYYVSLCIETRMPMALPLSSPKSVV